METLHKILTIVGGIVGTLSGLLVGIQNSVWAGGPPHWLAVTGTVLGVISMVVAKLLEVFSAPVQAAQAAVFANKQPAAAQAALVAKAAGK